MKYIKSSVVAMAGLVLATATSQASLIVDGSFEDVTLPVGSTWSYFTSIPGWTSENSTPIEVGTAATYGVSGADGANKMVMELDSTSNVSVDQIVGTADGLYTLSFLYAARQDQVASTLGFEVYWNSLLVATINPAAGQTTMQPYSVAVTGIDGTGYNTLTFKGTGTPDSYGALIDNVQLTPVPETSTVVAGALLLLPLGASTLRGFRKSRIA